MFSTWWRLDQAVNVPVGYQASPQLVWLFLFSDEEQLLGDISHPWHIIIPFDNCSPITAMAILNISYIITCSDCLLLLSSSSTFKFVLDLMASSTRATTTNNTEGVVWPLTAHYCSKTPLSWPDKRRLHLTILLSLFSICFLLWNKWQYLAMPKRHSYWISLNASLNPPMAVQENKDKMSFDTPWTSV